MALNTFGWTPAEVTTDSAGNVVPGVTLTVFTDVTKSNQVTGLFDKDGVTALPSGVVVSDNKGRFGFKASDAYSMLYVYDGSTADPWPIAAHEALDAGTATHAQAVADAQAAADSAAASAALVGAPADTAIATAINGAGTQTRAALTAGFTPQWKASTAYTAGQAVVNPSGDVVTAKVAFTSGATYNAANWNFTPAVAGKVAKGDLWFNVKDYGAKGDGTTDDRNSIQSALDAASAAGGGTVYFPRGVYAIATRPTAKANVRMLGESPQSVTIKATVAMAYMIQTAVAGATFEGITWAANGLVSASCITLSAGASGITIRNCQFTDVGYFAGQGVEMFQVSDVTVDGCLFAGMQTGLMVNGSCQRVAVTYNRFTDWKSRGIYILGSDANGATEALLLQGNRLWGMVSNTGARYPIHSTSSTTTPHRNIRVLGNHLVGRGTSYTNPTTPGVADQISMHNTRGFMIANNVCRDGGDMGITIENSKMGTVVGNVCSHNDVAGITIWNSSDATVSGNTCYNNGQNRQGDRNPDVGRAGVLIQGSQRVVVTGNVAGDDQATKTQVYGVSLQNTDTVTIGPDLDAGNATALYYKYLTTAVNTFKVTTAAF